MSLLPRGRSLRNFLPDLDDLLYNPAEYLAIGPLVFGPRRMYGIAALFAVPGIVLVGAFFLVKRDPELIALGIGLLLGSSIWFGWSVTSRGHQVSLQKDGVEFRYFESSVWCPWALFNAAGAPHVPELDSPQVAVILPVAAEAIPFVELRRAESVVAHGAAVRSPQFRFLGKEEIVLTGRYEVASNDVGQLLLQIGQRLGYQLPRGAPPPEAFVDQPVEELETDPAGWISLPATRGAFPPTCSSCGKATREEMHLEAPSRIGRLMTILVPMAAQSATLAVPVCGDCQSEIRARRQRGAVAGMVAGAILGPLAIMIAGWANGWGLQMLNVVGLLTVAVGGLLGFAIGNSLAFRPPVEVGAYRPARGTILVRFRNHDYAAAVLALLRQRR